MEHISDSIPGWFSFPKFYRSIVEKFPEGSRLVEIGTYKGKSFSYLVVEPDFNQFMEPLKGHFRTLFGGDSFDRAKDFEDGSIDFLFIDANHTYEYVIRDLQAFLPKMKKGGVISGHDHNDQHPGVIRACREFFPEPVNYDKEEDVWSVQL